LTISVADRRYSRNTHIHDPHFPGRVEDMTEINNLHSHLQHFKCHIVFTRLNGGSKDSPTLGHRKVFRNFNFCGDHRGVVLRQ